MPKLTGQFTNQLDATSILNGWHTRYGAEIAPKADMSTDGFVVSIDYSPSWDIKSLKHSIQLEVHRIDPVCHINWIEDESEK